MTIVPQNPYNIINATHKTQQTNTTTQENNHHMTFLSAISFQAEAQVDVIWESPLLMTHYNVVREEDQISAAYNEITMLRHQLATRLPS